MRLFVRLAAAIIATASLVGAFTPVSYAGGSAELWYSKTPSVLDPSKYSKNPNEFPVCGSETRDIYINYSYCNNGLVPEVVVPGPCGPGGFGANPYRLTHTLYRNGVAIATRSIQTSSAWAQLLFDDQVVTPGTYIGLAKLEVRKVVWRRILPQVIWQTVETVPTNSFVVSSLSPPAQAQINGVWGGLNGAYGTSTSQACPGSQIVLKGKSYPCASGYFVSVALANAAGVNTGPEYMRWLTDADYASFGPITNFNLTGFFASYGQVFVPGEYYHVKLALGPTWNETSILVYVKPAIVSSGMTAWFPLNETSGTIATELFGNSGEYLGDVTHVIGVVGGAARFGTTGDIRVPNTAVADIGTGDFSFSVWIQTTLMGTAAILDKEQENSGPVTGYGLEISNGKPLLQLASGGAWQNYVSSTFVADGLWHHLVVTVDRDSSTGVRFYVDGVLAGTGNPLAVSGSLSNSFPLFIGGRADSTFGSPYVGDIDEVLIYNRSLDATEVSALYGGGTPSSCP